MTKEKEKLAKEKEALAEQKEKLTEELAQQCAKADAATASAAAAAAAASPDSLGLELDEPAPQRRSRRRVRSPAFDHSQSQSQSQSQSDSEAQSGIRDACVVLERLRVEIKEKKDELTRLHRDVNRDRLSIGMLAFMWERDFGDEGVGTCEFCNGDMKWHEGTSALLT